jgi:hypothetical protein
MRGRIVLFIVLAVATALAAAYLGASVGAPKAAGQPPPATTASSPAEPAHDRTLGPGPTRSPTGPSQQTGQTMGSPTASPPKPPPSKAGANPGGTATQPTAKPQPSTGPVRFGKVTTTPSGDTALLEVAPSDRRALGAEFSDREVQVGPGATEPATRSFAVTLPLTDGAKGETLRVVVQGYAYAQEGAYAQLTLKLNGQASVRYYRSGWDDSFAEVLEAPATPATTYRLEGVLEVHQKPGTGGPAYFNVASVEASIER